MELHRELLRGRAGAESFLHAHCPGWVMKYALDDGRMGRWIDLNDEKPTSGLTPAFVCSSFCVLERASNQSLDTKFPPECLPPPLGAHSSGF